MSDIKSKTSTDLETKSKPQLVNSKDVSLVSKTTSKIRSFFKGYRPPRYLVVGSIAFLSVTLILSAFALWTANMTRDTAKAGSTTFATGNITLDKKYVVNGTESDVVNTNPGGTVTVRLRYSNTGNSAATDANIKDTLPAGFTYVAGSFKNCLNPTSTELVCDTLNATNKNTAFTTLTSNTGMSATAGLYDAASNNAGGGTAPNSTAGVLDIGKKRYLNINQCQFSRSGGETFVTTSALQTTFGAGTNFSNTPGAANSSNCGVGGSGYSFYGSLNTALDGLGKRFLNINQCQYYASSTGDNFVTTAGLQNGFGAGTNFSTTPGATNSSSCGAGSSGSPYYGSLNTALDGLGKRFLNINQCQYYASSTGDNFVTTAGLQNGFGAGSNFSTTAGATNSSVCGAGGGTDGHTLASSASTAIDLLDTTRSSGYIEYQAQVASNTALGTYGTTTTLSSASSAFTPVTSGGNVIVSGNTTVGIVVSSTPTANVTSTKLYSTDGINWSPTITAYTGQTVYVRLLRDNSGTASANAVNQKDTIPSPFTYVAGSFNNCLAPTIASITDAVPDVSGQACDSLTATNKDTAFTKLISNTGISAAAGLYDAADTGANGTAISATTGLMEFGKARFIRVQSIGYTNGSAPDGCGAYIVSPSSTALSATGTANCGYIISVGITNRKFLQHESIGFTNFQPPNECVSYGAAWTGTNTNTTAGSGCASRIATAILGIRYLVVETIAYTNGTTTVPCSIYDAAITTSAGPVSATSGNACGSRSSVDMLDTTNGQGFIQYQMTTPNNATLGNYGTTGSLSSTDPANTFTQTNGSAGSGITLVNPPLTTSDIPGLTVVCGGGSAVAVNSTTSCTFTLPAGKDLPSDFKLGIGNGTPAGTCAVTNSTTGAVTCNNVPTGTNLGTQPINGQIGTGTVTPTGETAVVATAADPDLTTGPGSIGAATDCTNTTNVVIGQSYTCNFPISGTGPFALPAGGISSKTNQGSNNSNPVSTCTITGSGLNVLTCTGISTTASPVLTAGAANVQLGKGTTVATWNTKGAVNLTTGTTSNDIIFIDPAKVTFSPVENSAVKFGTADLTINVGGGSLDDPRFTSGGKTAVCKFRIKEYGASDTDATKGFDATTLKLVAASTGGSYNSTLKTFDVPYTVGTGCNAKIPPASQNQPKWFFEVRVFRSDSQLFGQNKDYFQTYGAIGGVSVSG